MTELPKQLPTIPTFEAGVSRRAVPAAIATLGAAISASRANALNSASLPQCAPNQDGLAALAASGGSALVSFQQSGTGAAARTVQAKERDVLHVADFLPVGYVTNGTEDYTTHMQAAINEAVASKRRLVFPNGTFAVSGTGLSIALTGPQQLVIQGQGSQNTVLYNANGNVLRVSGQFLTVSDILLLSNGGGHTVLQTGLLAQTLWTQVAISQNANGFSSWENAGQEFVDNRFIACAFDHTSASTVYGFNLMAAGGLINDNSWLNCRVSNSGTKHFFNVETTTANAQYANKWDGITFEVCLGGGIRMRGVNGFVIENCQNWDATGIINDFYDLSTASGIGCAGKISNCGRWASTLISGKYDVKLPSGGGGAGIVIENCRTVGGGDPFTVDAVSNSIVALGIPGVFSVINNIGQCGFDPTRGVIVGGLKIAGIRDTGWTAMTGTGSKGALAAAAAGTASGAYVQAELQGALNRIAALEARLKSYDAALIAHGLIGA